MHGGIGMTDEHEIGFFMKRARVAQATFGTAAFHRDRYADLRATDAMSALGGNNGPRYRHVAANSAPYETIAVDKLTPIIGAEIGGIDLGQPMSNRQQDEVHRALAENCVIFFRDQHITPDQHLAFGRLFGDLHVHPAAPHDAGRARADDHPCRQGSPRANGEGWHTDVSCDVEPPMGSILYIKTCPPKGGDTLFASDVRGLRRAVRSHEDLSRRADRDP